MSEENNAGKPGEGTKTEPQEQDLAKKLEELGVKTDSIKKAIDAGVLMEKPKSLDDLPEDVRAQINKEIEAKANEAAKTVKDQLYSTVDKYKTDLAELKKFVDAEKEARAEIERKAEEERKAKEEATMTLEEKLKQAQEEQRQQLESYKSEAQKQMEALQLELHKERLKGYMNEKLGQYEGKLIKGMIPDLEKNPNITPDELDAALQASHEQYLEIAGQIEEQVKSTLPPQQQKSPMSTLNDRLKSAATNSTISHPEKPFDPSKLANMSKEERMAEVERIMAQKGNLR